MGSIQFILNYDIKLLGLTSRLHWNPTSLENDNVVRCHCVEMNHGGWKSAVWCVESIDGLMDLFRFIIRFHLVRAQRTYSVLDVSFDVDVHVCSQVSNTLRWFRTCTHGDETPRIVETHLGANAICPTKAYLLGWLVGLLPVGQAWRNRKTQLDKKAHVTCDNCEYSIWLIIDLLMWSIKWYNHGSFDCSNSRWIVWSRKCGWLDPDKMW